MKEANRRLFESLGESGFVLEDKPFKKAHRDAALHFLEESQRDGRETHNSLWISVALKNLGYHTLPDDPKISKAVDDYFSAFYDYCYLIPGTKEMLETLEKEYRLGLLSNFTHAPAARKIIENLGINPFFEVILISGELGYRKPHPAVFSNLIEQLGVEKNQIVFIGDDLEPDIEGAKRAGLQPVWTTYVYDQNIPATPAVFSRGKDTPDSDVPRISTWEDLLSLLDKDK